MSFTYVSVTGSYLTAGQALPAAGAVTFTPTAPMRNGSTVVGSPVRVVLVAGAVPGGFTLAAVDDPGTTPTGVTYRVLEQVGSLVNRYTIVVPRAGGSIDLGSVARAEPVPTGRAVYQLLGDRGVAGGYAPLDGTGKVPAVNLPAGGGGGAVTSVSARIGDVVLVKGDVGLGSVDNTADAAKPVSTLQASALALKADATALTAEVGRATGAEGSLTTAVAGKAPAVHVHAEADVTSLVTDLSALTSSVAARVASVTAADTTITVGGTATAPTVGVGTIPQSKVTSLPADLSALTASVAARVASVTAADSTVTVAGTATAPTVGVGTVPQSKVTNLVTDLSALTASVAARVASVTAADTTITVAGTATAPTVGVGAIAESKVVNLVADLAAKAATVHVHAEADVTSLVTDLAAKAATVHVHAESDVTSLVADLAAKAGQRPVPASGWYIYTASASSSGTSATLTNGNLRTTPWFVEKAVTIVRIGAEVTVAGDVGSKLRLGLFGDNGACYPGALLLDAGQIAGDVVGVQELTISLALPVGLYWPAAVVQSVTTTQPTIRAVSNWTAPVPLSPGTSLPSGTMVGYLQSGVTAALAGPFSSTVSTSGASARVFVRLA